MGCSLSCKTRNCLQRLTTPKSSPTFDKFSPKVVRHPNRRYFILKSIVINNLYGVDIMKEAVEICKLRLFLKLIAQVDKVRDLEPLPDIDFNIRPGNSLVGFVSLDDVKKTLEGTLGFGEKEVDRIAKEADAIEHSFKKFRTMQTEQGADANNLFKAKTELRTRLGKLRVALGSYLATQYGVDPDKTKEFQKWEDRHQSFHWFSEFYGIMSDGGFDVIIGNPPYVASRKVSNQYTIRGYMTASCPDIYAWFLERVCMLAGKHANTGMIVPLSLGFSTDFDVVRRLLFSNYVGNWFSSFGRIPSALFSYDVRVRKPSHMPYCSRKPANLKKSGSGKRRMVKQATQIEKEYRGLTAISSSLFQSKVWLMSYGCS